MIFRKGAVMNTTARLPIGIENFEDIRRKGFYYVDKTALIKDLLEGWGGINLFTRPRRFGKSLNMNMLKYFLNTVVIRSFLRGLPSARNRSFVRNIWESTRLSPSP